MNVHPATLAKISNKLNDRYGNQYCAASSPIPHNKTTIPIFHLLSKIVE
ncbi:hypothetical protein Cabys_3386 [Caldithrix abyssi DSM 13497]|uniref:Uncharacterized protein n=1 Tax=Caldithrix abyssi DSM 13497 TaxID=880073 RepID=A0A1J1CC65_CALAY|nr:hypothetical protein Cabys_3386 [Caldithrix abyssi DSM 13497]